MTRRRWIADEFSDTQAALTGRHAEHLVRVLRARIGQEFDIAAGKVVRRGRIIHIAEDRVDFELGAELPSVPSIRITLLLSIFKFDRMEWAIEKCTELGVARIVPIIARRTDIHLASAATKRAERWRRIAIQAAEQSRRTTSPEIADPMKLQDAAQTPGALRILLSESEQNTTFQDALESVTGEVILAVGPEGGWAEEELQAFQQAGWLAVSLGPTILRAETAAIAAAAIAQSQLL